MIGHVFLALRQLRGAGAEDLVDEEDEEDAHEGDLHGAADGLDGEDERVAEDDRDDLPQAHRDVADVVVELVDQVLLRLAVAVFVIAHGLQ